MQPKLTPIRAQMLKDISKFAKMDLQNTMNRLLEVVYMDEKLKKQIFKKSALHEIYQVTGGIPRLINIVCDSALLQGYSREMKSCDGSMIRDVARDLDLVRQEPAEPTTRSEAGGSRRWFGLFG